MSASSTPTPAGDTRQSIAARLRTLARAMTTLLAFVCTTVALVAQPVATAAAEGMTATGKWTQPTILSGCPGTGAPHVVFPSDSPTHGTGPGAIVWSTSSPCPAGAGVLVAAISPEDDDVPGQPALPRTASGQTIALRGSVAATPGPYGRIVIAGASAGEHTAPAGELLLTEGRAGGPFASPTALGGPASTFAFTTAYLGDVALASLIDAPRESATQLRVQRHHADRFAAPALLGATGAAGSSSVQALTVALDYRSDALAVWSAQGPLYARGLPPAGTPQPLQRLGP